MSKCRRRNSNNGIEAAEPNKVSVEYATDEMIDSRDDEIIRHPVWLSHHRKGLFRALSCNMASLVMRVLMIWTGSRVTESGKHARMRFGSGT